MLKPIQCPTGEDRDRLIRVITRQLGDALNRMSFETGAAPECHIATAITALAATLEPLNSAATADLLRATADIIECDSATPEGDRRAVQRRHDTALSTLTKAMALKYSEPAGAAS